MRTMYGTPAEVVFCRRCVISNQRPNSVVEFASKAGTPKETISIGHDGVCSACRYADTKETIDWSVREEQLTQLLDRHRRASGYDVVVPGSGGKDSAFTAHVLKYRYGMNPLTVTWAPHLFTEIGWQNFTNWSHVGGLDNLLMTPNGRLHRYLTRIAFLQLLHPFQPFIVGQRLIGPTIALKFGIPLVMYGENQAEYGNSIEENSSPLMDSSFFESNSEPYFGGVSVSEIRKSTDFSLADFAPYMPPDPASVEQSGLEVHYLGYYLKWDPQECYYYAAEHTGFEANDRRTEGSYSKYSSIDDKIDPFHYFTTLVKFGIGRATYDASQEIRNGKITREEGVELVRQFDGEFPSRYFPDFLDYIGIDSEEFFRVVNAARPSHLWRLRGDEWELRHPVWEA